MGETIVRPTGVVVRCQVPAVFCVIPYSLALIVTGGFPSIAGLGEMKNKQK